MDIINVLVILFYGVVFVFQYQLIKSLKDKLSVIEQFHKVFDISKVTEYVQFINKKHEEDKAEIIKKKTEETIKSVIKIAIDKMPDDLKEKHSELLYFAFKMLILVEPFREKHLLEMPLNEEMLRGMVYDFEQWKALKDK